MTNKHDIGVRQWTGAKGKHGGTGTQEAEPPAMSLCIVTYRMVAPCDRCGRQATPVHMPRQEHGLYCSDCCPVCSKRKDDSPASTLQRDG